jgi:hypothetical protein
MIKKKSSVYFDSLTYVRENIEILLISLVEETDSW